MEIKEYHCDDNLIIENDTEEILFNHIKLNELLNENSKKSLQWLKFFINDPEIEDLYSNAKRTKCLLLIQCLFYLNIVKNIHKSRYGFDKTSKQALHNISTVENTNFLPSIVINSKSNYKELNYSEKNIHHTHDKDKIFNSNSFKIGIIGCGNIGSFLLKNLISIKDNLIMDYKIIVSTRRPSYVYSNLLNEIDDYIEIVLDNEKVFAECQIIFICVQPHQLDLLISEVSLGFKERIDKLKITKNIIFPTIISLLTAVPLEKLKNLFPNDVNVQRTNIDFKLFRKYSDNNFYKKEFQNKDKTKLKISPIKNKNIHNITKYAEEAFLHLLKLEIAEINLIEKFLWSFKKITFYKTNKMSQIEIVKYGYSPKQIFSNDLLIALLGENYHDLFLSNFDKENNKFFEESTEKIICECKKNFITVMENIYEKSLKM